MPQADPSHYRTFRPGEVIIKQGDPNPTTCVIKSGKVQVFKHVGNKRVALAELGKGEIFGEMSLISGEPATATVEAVETTEVLLLEPEVLQGLLSKCPAAIRHVLRFMRNRLERVSERVGEEPGASQFYAVSSLIDIYFKAEAPTKEGARGDARPNGRGADLMGVSYRKLSRRIKDILGLNQVDIDRVVKLLEKFNLVVLRDVKGETHRTTALGDKVKDGVYVADSLLGVNDPASFLKTARAMAQELEGSAGDACLEYLDVEDFARAIGADTGILYKKIGMAEFPPSLVLIPKTPALEWAREMGPDFFKKAKRKKLNLEELETVEDIAAVDNATLQAVFQDLGFHKLSVLYAAARDAGADEAVAKMEANFSKKIREVVAEEAEGMAVDEAELAEIEAELYDAVRARKAAK